MSCEGTMNCYTQNDGMILMDTFSILKPDFTLILLIKCISHLFCKERHASAAVEMSDLTL